MLNKHKVGMAVACVAGAWHVVWSLLVALDWARPLMDFIHGLHFLKASYTMSGFNLGTAVALVVVASLIGYIWGWAFAYFWNRLQK